MRKQLRNDGVGNIRRKICQILTQVVVKPDPIALALQQDPSRRERLRVRGDAEAMTGGGEWFAGCEIGHAARVFEQHLTFVSDRQRNTGLIE